MLVGIYSTSFFPLDSTDAADAHQWTLSDKILPRFIPSKLISTDCTTIVNL